VQVRAVANRLQFSNFADRYDPERAQQAVTLSLSAQARLGERLLLEDMRTASTVTYAGAVEVGAARQWLEAIYRASAGMRYRHRAARAVPLVAVVPEWLGDVVGIDVLKQAPGDNMIDQPIDGMDWIARHLDNAGIRAIFQRDDARTNNALGAGGIAFSTQTGSGASLNPFPGRCETILFPEGSYLYLDGGQLDFGLVRDSALNSQNRFQTFTENFEGLAFVGVESIDLTALICMSGGAAALVSSKCGDGS
jgi:hypothetical protein